MSTGRRVVFFDVDDTLLFFQPSPMALFKESAFRFGLGDFSDAEILHAYQAAGKFYFTEGLNFVHSQVELLTFLNEIMLADLGIEDKDLKYSRLIAEHTDTNMGHAIFPDTEPALACLVEEGFTLAAITGRIHNTEPVLIELGIRQYFSYYMNSGKFKLVKPSRDFYGRPRLDLGICEGDCIALIDDDPVAVRFASGEGFNAFLIDRFGNFCGDDCRVLSSLSQLPEVLKSLN